MSNLEEAYIIRVSHISHVKYDCIFVLGVCKAAGIKSQQKRSIFRNYKIKTKQR